MKKTIITTVIFLLTGLFVNAQEGAKPAFSTMEYDFGNVEEGPQYTAKIIVTNEGKKDLLFINASTSCGCTVAKYPKKHIAPGGSDTILVTFNSARRFGNFTKDVKLWDNAGTKYELRIKGYVKPDRALMEVTQKTIDVGEISNSKDKEITITFKNRGTEKLVIASVKPSCGYINADFSTMPVAFDEEGNIIVKISTKGRSGDFECQVNIQSNSYVYQSITIKGKIISGK